MKSSECIVVISRFYQIAGFVGDCFKFLYYLIVRGISSTAREQARPRRTIRKSSKRIAVVQEQSEYGIDDARDERMPNVVNGQNKSELKLAARVLLSQRILIDILHICDFTAIRRNSLNGMTCKLL